MKRRATMSKIFCSVSLKPVRRGAGRDDGEVIADLGVVEDALVRAAPSPRASAFSRVRRRASGSSKLPMTLLRRGE